jgi:hypothetical protein
MTQAVGKSVAKWLTNLKTIFKFCLLAFFLFLMWTGRTYPEESRLFPELLGIVTVIIIIVSLIVDFMKTKGTENAKTSKTLPPELSSSDIREEKMRLIKEIGEKSEKDAGYELLEEGLRKKRLIQAVLIVLVSLVVGYLGGFLLTVPFYFLAFGTLHGQRKHIVKYILIAAGVTLLVYLFFTFFMGVPLLRGALWGEY